MSQPHFSDIIKMICFLWWFWKPPKTSILTNQGLDGVLDSVTLLSRSQARKLGAKGARGSLWLRGGNETIG